MNYRDFYKNKKATAKDIQNLIPEGVDQKEFQMGIDDEKEHTDNEFLSAKIAGDHLKGDPHYYSKLKSAGLEEEGCDEHCGACEDDMGEEPGNEFDDNGGLPKIGGALAVPHTGQPIMMGKIIQVGGIGGGPASGELSGMTSVSKGVTKDAGGVPVQQQNDSETITAGGKKVDSSIASKSVGGEVVSGEGQKQGGKNTVGTIASTSKLAENKDKLRKTVKNVLKEIKYNKATGKWEKINEETVNMKMGASYKTVQPRQYKVMDDDTARTNQYEPEITEMLDDEEETKMNERYVELANEQRNLSAEELSELTTLREKIDKLAENRCNEDGERSDYDIASTETNPNDYKKCDGCGKQNYMCDCPSKHGEEGDFGHDGFSRKAGVDEENGYGDEHPDDARERHQFQRGIARYNRSNPQRFECPTCKTPNALSADQKRKGYQCDRCADAEEGAFQETVNIKMGKSYKTVQPRQYKVADDDVARTNQYDPQIQENDGVFLPPKQASKKPTQKPNPAEPKVNLKPYQGQRFTGGEEWQPGVHLKPKNEQMDEAGGQSVQHRSFRTAKDVPQDPKVRWDDEVNEGESKVAKTIRKGQKGQTSTKAQSLKHKSPKKTSTGVHKRKI